MLKVCFIAFIVFFIGCKPIRTNKEINFKDSVVMQYLNRMDSSEFYDTTDYEYKVLKAYVNNNLDFFKEMERAKRKAEEEKNKYPPRDTCIRLKKLSQYNADEVYRFRHSQSFCGYSQIITIANQKDSIRLYYLEFITAELPYNYLEYRNDKGDTVRTWCRIVKEFSKRLTEKDWDSLKKKLDDADYWGLKPWVYSGYTDGSFWDINAYSKEPRYSTNQQVNSVSRHCPCNTSFDELGNYFLKLSGEKTMCGEFF